MSKNQPSKYPGGAVISEDKNYRYFLWREMDASKPNITFLLLNPSTASGDTDDPTIRKCIKYSLAWGYGTLQVVNLWAYRTPSPKELYKEHCKGTDIVGIENDRYIRQATCEGVDAIVCGFGNTFLAGLSRVQKVLELLQGATAPLTCLGQNLGLNKGLLGMPVHPLYQLDALTPTRYNYNLPSIRIP